VLFCSRTLVTEHGAKVDKCVQIYYSTWTMYLESVVMSAIEKAPTLDSLNIDEMVLPADNVPTIRNLEELEHGLSYAVAVLGQCVEVKDIVRHEGQHENAWRIMGAQVLGFGLRFFNLQEGNMSKTVWMAFVKVRVDPQKFTNLHIAAGAAHPVDPSVGDIRQVEERGFSIDEVAKRAIANNDAGGRFIPVPLSYSGKSLSNSH